MNIFRIINETGVQITSLEKSEVMLCDFNILLFAQKKKKISPYWKKRCQNAVAEATFSQRAVRAPELRLVLSSGGSTRLSSHQIRRHNSHTGVTA